TEQVHGFRAAGDAAYESGDYAAAIRQYENALALGANDAIVSRLADARVRKLLADAEAALAEGETDAARAALTEARRLSPDHAALAEAEQTFQVRSEYQAHLNAGDAARGRSDFAGAKAAYRRA